MQARTLARRRRLCVEPPAVRIADHVFGGLDAFEMEIR
jgi:hypothetical protein